MLPTLPKTMPSWARTLFAQSLRRKQARLLQVTERRLRLLPSEVSDEEVLAQIAAVPEHCSVTATGTYPECFFSNQVAFNAVTNTLSETSLLGGTNLQPKMQPPIFDGNTAKGRPIRIRGVGILGTTTTPTLTFKNYLNTTQGSGSLAGTGIGTSAAITTASTVSNKAWWFQLDIINFTPGQGTGNDTIMVMGWVESPAGFASPFKYTLTPGTGDSATVTATLDGSLTQFFNCSATWSAASASNTITLEGLICEALF